MKILFSIAFILLTTVACNSSKQGAKTDTIENKNKVQNTSLSSQSYRIIQVGNNTYFNSELTISFDEKTKKVAGFAGCNSFMGSYSTQGHSISFSNIATTRKFCKEEMNTLENHVLKALNSVNSFSIQNETLLLLEDETPLLAAQQSSITSKKDMLKDGYDTKITYETSTRGFYEYISISASDIIISEDRGLQEVRHYKCDEEDWNALNSLIEAVDLERFHQLKVPSEQHFSDAAAEATLGLQIGDVYYMSPAFDHGNPPKAIEALVNKVISIKEKTIKQ